MVPVCRASRGHSVSDVFIQPRGAFRITLRKYATQSEKSRALFQTKTLKNRQNNTNFDLFLFIDYESVVKSWRHGYGNIPTVFNSNSEIKSYSLKILTYK